MQLALFNPFIRPYEALPLRARVDLGAMAMKGYFAFPIAPALLEPQIFSVITVQFCRGAVGVFYSPNQLGNTQS